MLEVIGKGVDPRDARSFQPPPATRTTASLRVRRAFAGAGRREHACDTFPCPPAGFRDVILYQDAICVSDDDAANMLAIWSVHGIDEMPEAWENEIVLCGASAG